MITTDQKVWSYLENITAAAGIDDDRTALTDGVHSYSYRQLREQWRRYAAVFSAMHMTGSDCARVGLAGTTCPEVIFAFYGLNMVGAQVSMQSALCAMKAEKLIADIRREHLTDLILTDELISENTIREILRQKDELGLRSILLLHTFMGGSTIPAPLYASLEARTMTLHQLFPELYLDTLLRRYENTQIPTVSTESSECIIMHTSGTTGGSGKPVPLTDCAFNAICENLQTLTDYDELKKDLVSPVIVDLSNVFGMAIQAHLMLSFGATIVTIPGNSLNPMLYRAIPAHKISLLFCMGALLEMWMKFSASVQMDFSSIRMVILGGSYVSAADKHRYDKFLREHGAKNFVILNGYGISEVGGVCTLTGADLDDETIGYPLPGYSLKFFDEDTEVYHTMEDAPCTGVLYIHTESMTSGKLDDEQIIQMEELDGKPYLCTNDLIRLEKDGRLTYLGRANRYFLNGNGEKYQSGRVETEISRQKGIESCGIVPVFEKVGHDNIPMLCVSTVEGCPQPLETVRQALLQVFRIEKTLPVSNIPCRVLLAKVLPRNANGKIDLYKINRGEVDGRKYSVDVKQNACGTAADGTPEMQLADIRFTPLKDDDSNMFHAVYQGIAKDMAEGAIQQTQSSPVSTMWQMIAMQQLMHSWMLQQQSMWMMNCVNYYRHSMSQILSGIRQMNLRVPD